VKMIHTFYFYQQFHIQATAGLYCTSPQIYHIDFKFEMISIIFHQILPKVF